MEKIMVKQVASLQATEVHRGTDIHPIAHGEFHAGALKKALACREPALEVLVGAEACGEDPMQKHICWQDL